MTNHRRTILFVFLITILTLWWPDLSYNDNSVSRALAVMSQVEEGNLSIDEYQHLTGDKSFIGGNVYSDKAPLPVFVVYPLVKIIYLLNLYPVVLNTKLNLVLVTGGLLVSAIPLIFILTFLFRRIDKKEIDHKNYWLVTIPFLSSFIWVYNFSFYSHILAGCFLIVSFLMIKQKQWFIAGMLSGFAFLTEYPLLIIPVVWLLQNYFAEKNNRQLVAFIGGLLPVICLLLLYNYIISGQFIALSYDYVSDDYARMRQGYGFGFPSINAIFGMTFSPYRGLLFYAPLLLPFIYISIKNMANKKFKDFILHPWFIPFVIYLVLISSYFMWWGGWSYGPRHLMPIILFIFFYECTQAYLKKYFKILLIAGLAGLVLIVLVKSTVMHGFPSGLNPFSEVLFPALESEVGNTMNLPSILFDLKPSSSAIIFVSLYLLGGLLFSKKNLA